MRKIKVSLGNIDEAIRQVEEYEKKLQQNLKDFLTKMLESGVEIAKATVYELDAVESVDLYKSLDKMVYIEGERGVIFTDSPYACYVEFGAGVRGGETPHPTMPWEYDSNGHGEAGWWYWDDKQGRARWTQGMPSRPFMYYTAKELERRAVEIAREVFSR